MRSQSDLVNVVQYKYDEIYNDCRDFSHPPVQVGVSSLEASEPNLNTIPQGINPSSLDEIEYMVSQNRLEDLG